MLASAFKNSVVKRNITSSGLIAIKIVVYANEHRQNIINFRGTFTDIEDMSEELGFELSYLDVEQ